MTAVPFDKSALYTISAGMYVLATLDADRPIGRIVDAVSQVAAEPKRVSVSMMKAGYTGNVLAAKGQSARFTLAVLGVDAPMGVVKAFGYQSSETADKFAGFAVEADGAGVPYVLDGALAELSCETFGVLDMGSHWLILADVVEARTFARGEAMTYAGYRALKSAAKVKPAPQEAPKVAAEPKPEPATAETPAAPTAAVAAPAAPAKAPAAPTAKPRIAWRCMICGYTIEADELPEDFACPMCGVGRDLFERIEL